MLNKTQWATVLGILALTISFNAAADRHHGGHGHGHPGFGFYFGVPAFPRSYYYPYDPFYYPYYPPAVVTVPSEPPVYIERERPAPQSQQFPEGYWYYCSNPEGYYPYIKECPGGWRQVDPIPPR